jgi:hypothetical protein
VNGSNIELCSHACPKIIHNRGAVTTLSPAASRALTLARDRVSAVADDPEGRFDLASSYYERFGFGPRGGYGESALDFIRWEITRGVLNPPDWPQPGSRWWRSVNEGLLYHAEAAADLRDAGAAAEATGPVKAWVGYLESPSAHTWYRAHNASTVDGYLRFGAHARLESAAECRFINMVLYRVLYAQALVESAAPGLLGHLAHHFRRIVDAFERLLADPRGPSVDLLVHLPDFYPRHYPLSDADAADLFQRGHSPEALARMVMDQIFIAPCLTDLYKEAAVWLDAPNLTALVVNNAAIYPDCLLSDSLGVR